jgi:hypothetical protein
MLHDSLLTQESDHIATPPSNSPDDLLNMLTESSTPAEFLRIIETLKEELNVLNGGFQKMKFVVTQLFEYLQTFCLALPKEHRPSSRALLLLLRHVLP